MAEHTDRIKQMAQEAGFERFKDESVDPINFEPSPDGMWLLWDDDALARFAQLVAEDCARIADESEPRRGVGDEIRYYYSPTVAAPSQAG